MIMNFFRRDVDSILRGFDRVKAQLLAHAERSTERAGTHMDKAEDHRSEAVKHQAEAKRAYNVANKLADLMDAR